MSRKKKRRLIKANSCLLRIEIYLPERKYVKELRKCLNVIFKLLLTILLFSSAFPIDFNCNLELIQLIIEILK